MEKDIPAKELSIVIPTLNEESGIRRLLHSLGAQLEVDFEIIVADGGSSDRTLEVVKEFQSGTIITTSKKGKAYQLNAGASLAGSDLILFIHADSCFNDRTALRRSLDFLKSASLQNSGKPQAGHFQVCFRCSTDKPSPVFQILEAKAALDRKGCSHGDQGIVIPAGLLRQMGGFDESCQVLAETRLADALRDNGQWHLLPAEISTSARRFEKDGVYTRQMINAMIMALGAAKADGLIESLSIYPENGQSPNQRIRETLGELSRSISKFDRKMRSHFWREIGCYLAENLWQLPFWADLLLIRTTGIRRFPFLKLYDAFFRRVAENRATGWLAGCSARLFLAITT